MENIIVQINDPLLFDRLHTLSVEYSLSKDLLVNLAIKRLLDDVDLIRNLRAGTIENL